jgi:hypothetical protein
MSVSVTNKSRTVPGANFRTKNIIGGDAAYPTGGYAITPQQLGFNSFISDIIRCDATALGSAIYCPVLTPTYGADGITITGLQFQLENYTAATEVANGTNVSAQTYELIVEGR